MVANLPRSAQVYGRGRDAMSLYRQRGDVARRHVAGRAPVAVQEMAVYMARVPLAILYGYWLSVIVLYNTTI